MLRELTVSLRLLLLCILITGLAYPLLMLGLGQILFPAQANGSLIVDQGKIIGSHLIGQSFTSDRYFHGRPSAAGTGYDATQSSGSNLALTSPDLIKAVSDRIAALRQEGITKLIPADLVTSSASGLDPHISVDAAQIQVSRVAAARNLNPEKLHDLVSQATEPRSLAFLGENRVNVLELNRLLDKIAPHE